MLKKLASDEVQAQLAVADSKLGGIIREGKFRKPSRVSVRPTRADPRMNNL